jgi:hypothetical protein
MLKNSTHTNLEEMKMPEYTDYEPYKIIADWCEKAGIPIRYEKFNPENGNFAYTYPKESYEDGGYIVMYDSDEVYIKYGEQIGRPYWSASHCATCVLAHELAHTIFVDVDMNLFRKMFGIAEEVPFCFGDSEFVEEACDCFGNFLVVLAERMVMNTPER